MMNKAQRSPRKKSPIPDDFDPEKYWFKEDFSLWMNALAHRVALQKDIKAVSVIHSRVLQDESSEPHSALCKILRKDCENKVIALINEPIPVDEKPCKTDENAWWHRTADAGSDPQFFYWHSELANRENYLKRHEPIGGTLVLDGIWPPSRPVLASSYTGDVGLKVNLLYDDDVLRRSFSEWLKITRITLDFPMAGKKVVKSKQLEDWHRMRVLPYMDLWLYKQVFDVQFDRKDVAKCLFENDIDGDHDMDYERRLQNTRKCAMNLIKPSVFLSLRYKET